MKSKAQQTSGGIYAVGGIKGGPGKSMVARNLAAKRALLGSRFLLVDSDRIKTTSRWAETRQKKNAGPEIRYERIVGADIQERLLACSKEYDDVLVDCPGHDSIELRLVLPIAKQLIVPCRPTQDDLDTLPDLMQSIAEYRGMNKDLRIRLMMSQVIPGTETRKREGVQQIIDAINRIFRAMKDDAPQFELMEAMTTMRNTYTDCQKLGKGVMEFAGKREIAPKEIEKLHAEVWNG